MSANNYQFIQTRNMFSEYLSGYPKNLSYEEWLKADDDDKAALLFLNFYQEVTLAWYDAVVSKNIVYLSQEDGISTALQHLMKNVEKIANDGNRYNAKYIYRVVYNSYWGLWRMRNTEKQRCGCEISNEYSDGDIMVNLWDLYPSEDEDLETQQTKEAIWNIIRHMGPKAEKVVNHLINPSDSLHKLPAKSSERQNDRLADVSVSKSEYMAIIEELKVKLAPYRDALMTL